MVTVDLFWSPAKGDLVWFKPGSHGWDGLMPEQRKHPLRVAKEPKRLDKDGPLMTWVEPTGPVREIPVKGGPPRKDKPSWQQPCLVDELMPYDQGETK